MSEQTGNDQAFEALSQESRVARTARMLDEKTSLQENQRTDIIERFFRFIEEHGYTQTAVARELNISSTTISDVLRRKWTGHSGDAHLVKVHNWMELAARRQNIVGKRKFVEHSVAAEILQVAGIVAETCKMGAVFGPAQTCPEPRRISKSMTLEAIQGDQRFGDPVLIRVDESMLRPFAFPSRLRAWCRAVATRFELSVNGTFDAVFRRVVTRLTGTKRMLILRSSGQVFDEVERVHYETLELIRDLHDQTGCPVLLCGKPKIFAKLGLRQIGDFSEVTDQLSSRIIMHRDLTLRTRGKKPQPLFSLDDIRKLIHRADVKLHVAPDAVKWLQMRASTLGTGGLGRALACFYLACKVAFVQSADTITAQNLEDVTDMTMGDEDAQRVAEVVAESSGMRRVV